ncbi:Ankyrin [Phytophthora palmivora]|uniref:Ankyrin n=1 Tax=Phytophthora palmivora TaxID=4796 RepID=A0A2P4XSK0_9STRA|nr:Ankyrin [Phytophthora palmivora]
MSANRVVSKQTEELFRASEIGDVQVVKDLVKDPQVDINWHCTQAYGATPLIAAISNGHQEIVQILLEADAELGVLKTPDRNSPLHEAAFRGDPHIVQLVLDKIMEKPSEEAAELINQQNQFGNTPLHNAARTGSPGCVSCLLQAGAGHSVKNVNGSIALHHACYSEQPNVKVVQLLVEAGSDANALDEQGCSPLIVAAKKNQTEAIDFLRKHGADITLANSFGENALHFAELRNNTNAIHLLE